MDAVRTVESGAETIWLCGRPSFLREILVQVLKEALGAHQIHDAVDLEPPALVVPETARWLVWFVNTRNQAARVLEPFAVEAAPFNLILIEMDGQTLIRRDEPGRLRRLDLSLDELVTLMRTVDRPRPPQNPSQGGANASYRR